MIAKNVHKGCRIEDFEILRTVPEATELLNKNSFKVVVVVNQSGIVPGYPPEKIMSKIQQKNLT